MVRLVFHAFSMITGVKNEKTVVGAGFGRFYVRRMGA